MVMPQAPKVPRAPARRRTFEREGREQRPFKMEFPIPDEENEKLLEEFAGWHAATNGSWPEFICWKWLVNAKQQREGIDFFFQHPLFGGRTVYGGFLLDFYFPQKGMGWRVMGIRWHLHQPRDRARDLVAKQTLESRGIRLVDIWEDHLETSKQHTLELAWRGQEVVSRRGQ